MATTKKKKSMTPPQPPPPEEDRISNLPEPILHCILSLLPIKEAGRTTVLSESWTHHFHSIPDLRISCYEDEEDSIKLVESIYDILDARTAPINSFHVSADCFEPWESNFRDILRSLIRLRIKNLTLHNTEEHYHIPSFLFSCRTLTCLDLNRCTLSVPAKFPGLRKLRKLRLDETKVIDDNLENFVASCRALEELVIHDCYRVKNVVIRAHKLTTLEVSAHRRLDVSIVDAPCLDNVSFWFNFDMADTFNAIHDMESDDSASDASYSYSDDIDYGHGRGGPSFLQGLTSIQSLSLSILAGHGRLSEDRVLPPKSLPVGSHLLRLKTLSLRLDLSSPTYISVLSCLLLSCPMLRELLIIVEDECKGFLESADCWGEHPIPPCMVNHLRTVKMVANFGYNKYWIEFVKFTLKSASVLEKMVIYRTFRICDQSLIDRTTEELMLLPKASVDAVLTVAPPECCFPYF